MKMTMKQRDVFFWTLLVALLVVLAVVGWAAPNQAIVHTVTLPPGGLPESWSVAVPGAPWLPTRVEVDLQLTVTGRAGYEQLGHWNFKPWGQIVSRDVATVERQGQRVHAEPLALHVIGPGVSYDFDGVIDFGGQSGVQFGGMWDSVEAPTVQANPASWQMVGQIPLDVACGAQETGFISAVPTWIDQLSVELGGELVVRYYP